MPLESVQIFNQNTKLYEELNLTEYTPLNASGFYVYKELVYEHNSQITATDIDAKDVQLIFTKNHYYFTNGDSISGIEHSSSLDLNGIQVLRLKNGDLSNYLIGNGFLIFNNQIISDVDTESANALTENVALTKTHLFVEHVSYPLSDLPFEIRTLN